MNLASRIEGLTRHYGVDLLVGAATRDEVGAGLPADDWRWVEVDRKILAELAVNDVPAFTALVDAAREALPEDVNAPKAS